MDYEQLGTSAVIQAISKTDRLKPFVNNGDKEPSYDGGVYIYNNDKYAKDNIKRVLIQVKSKGVQSKPPAEIQFPVSVIDLDNYMHNGGVMFFVVYYDKATGETKQIYYSALLPFKIKAILKGANNEKKKISIAFRVFPSAPNEITDLFLNFYSDAQKQISFAEKDLPTITELQKSGTLESLSFSYVSAAQIPGITSYPKILDGKEVYLYANIKGGVVPIPVEHYAQITQLHMGYADNIPVSVNGIIYYECVTKVITANELIYHIGSSVTITVPNIDRHASNAQDFKLTISVKLKGTLKQRIKALEFLNAVLNAKSFELGGIKLPVDFTDTELKRLVPDPYKALLKKYKQYAAVLKKLHVKKDVSLDNFANEDHWKLNSLVEAIENKAPIKNIKGTLTTITNVNFGGLHLVMLCKKQKDGSYKIWDYFSKHIDVCFIDENDKPYTASQYSVMKAADFLSVDNLYLPSIIEDYKHIEPQPYIAENGNLVMLEMLKAYDEKPNEELFGAVKQMYAWLETVSSYLSEEVMIINKLQIVRRERELTFAEKQELYNIACNSENITYKIGALILLSEQNEAQKLLDNLPQEEKDILMSFPIFKFYTKTEKTTLNKGDNI